MKILILITLALLIISCDEDNLVRDDRVNEKREGWVVIDSIQIDDLHPGDIIGLKDNSLYIHMFLGAADHGGYIYKKELNNKAEYVSTVWFSTVSIFNFINNIILAGDRDRLVISYDYGRNYFGVDTAKFLEPLAFIDGMKKNDELYLLTRDQGIIKLHKGLLTYDLIDSSFFKTDFMYGNEHYNNPYDYFNIFDNNDCLLFDFNNDDILFISENFTKKQIIKPNLEFFNEYKDYNNYRLRRWISVVNNNIIFCTTSNGLYKSIDRGKTWELILDIKIKFWSKLITINENIIYLLDFNNDESTLYVSLDGGNSFDIQETPKDIIFYDIYFENSNIGYALGNNGEILKTTSGGFKD